MIRKVTTYIIILTFVSSCKVYDLAETKKPEWWEGRIESVATIVELRYQPEQLFFYEFKYNGKTYKGGYQEPFDRELIVEVGSKFEVAFNPNNPKENILLYFRPIFNNKNIDSTIGLVRYYSNLKIFNGDTINILGYEYRIGRRIYKNWTFVENDILPLDKLEGGDIVSIFYSKQNPRISRVDYLSRKQNSIITYLNTTGNVESRLLKLAKSINYYGTIYWLRHPDLGWIDDRKIVIKELKKKEPIKFENVQVIVK